MTGGAAVKCLLLDGQKISPAEDYFSIEDEKARAEALEQALNDWYGQLRTRLNEADKQALKEKQLRWLKKRQAADANVRDLLTAERVAYLRAWAEN